MGSAQPQSYIPPPIRIYAHTRLHHAFHAHLRLSLQLAGVPSPMQHCRYCHISLCWASLHDTTFGFSFVIYLATGRVRLVLVGSDGTWHHRCRKKSSLVNCCCMTNISYYFVTLLLWHLGRCALEWVGLDWIDGDVGYVWTALLAGVHLLSMSVFSDVREDNLTRLR